MARVERETRMNMSDRSNGPEKKRLSRRDFLRMAARGILVAGVAGATGEMFNPASNIFGPQRARAESLAQTEKVQLQGIEVAILKSQSGAPLIKHYDNLDDPALLAVSQAIKAAVLTASNYIQTSKDEKISGISGVTGVISGIEKKAKSDSAEMTLTPAPPGLGHYSIPVLVEAGDVQFLVQDGHVYLSSDSEILAAAGLDKEPDDMYVFMAEDQLVAASKTDGTIYAFGSPDESGKIKWDNGVPETAEAFDSRIRETYKDLWIDDIENAKIKYADKTHISINGKTYPINNPLHTGNIDKVEVLPYYNVLPHSKTYILGGTFLGIVGTRELQNACVESKDGKSLCVPNLKIVDIAVLSKIQGRDCVFITSVAEKAYYQRAGSQGSARPVENILSDLKRGDMVQPNYIRGIDKQQGAIDDFLKTRFAGDKETLAAQSLATDEQNQILDNLAQGNAPEGISYLGPVENIIALK